MQLHLSWGKKLKRALEGRAISGRLERSCLWKDNSRTLQFDRKDGNRGSSERVKVKADMNLCGPKSFSSIYGVTRLSRCNASFGPILEWVCLSTSRPTERSWAIPFGAEQNQLGSVLFLNLGAGPVPRALFFMAVFMPETRQSLWLTDPGAFLPPRVRRVAEEEEEEEMADLGV